MLNQEGEVTFPYFIIYIKPPSTKLSASFKSETVLHKRVNKGKRLGEESSTSIAVVRDYID